MYKLKKQSIVQSEHLKFCHVNGRWVREAIGTSVLTLYLLLEFLSQSTNVLLTKTVVCC